MNIQDLQDEEKKDLFLKQLLLVQILNSSWRELYRQIITSNGKILKKLISFIPIDINKVRENLESKSETQIDPGLKEIFEKYKSNTKLWDFLNKDNLDILTNVSDWNVFRRASRLTEEITFADNESYKALELLKAGNIPEFNYKRVKYFGDLNLVDSNLEGTYLEKANLAGVNLAQANLAQANLKGANLAQAYLVDSNLEGANLEGANLVDSNLEGANLVKAYLIYSYLAGANLVKANLEEANLAGANLVKANLEEASLAGANLAGATLAGANLAGANLAGATLAQANLVDSNLEKANLEGARLSNSLIINPRKYQSLKINEATSFNDSIIDDTDFIDYINNFTKIIPTKIKHKNQLKIMLEGKRLPEMWTKQLLALSKLPG